VTEQFCRGARETLKLARMYGAGKALLKEKSPSCGSGKIYDGTFSKQLVTADGITAKLLKEQGIRIFGESEIERMVEDHGKTV
jgi:uncharacterized protein YbbK (DUF523 family)